MIDTDKYEGMTYDNSTTSGIELEIAVQDLLAEVMRLREKNRHLQDLLVKARGDCWECGMPLDSCDSHNCERQRQEDIELGMIE